MSTISSKSKNVKPVSDASADAAVAVTARVPDPVVTPQQRALLTDLLTLIGTHIESYCACVISDAENMQQRECLAVSGTSRPDEQAALKDNFYTYLATWQPSLRDPLWLDRPAGTFGSGLLFPLVAADEVVGLLALLTETRPTPSQLDAIRPLVGAVESVLETIYLRSMTASIVQSTVDGVEQVRASLMSGVTDAVLIVMPSPVGSHAVMANDHFARLFGLEAADTRNRTLAELIDRMPLAASLRDDLRRRWLAIPVRDPDIHTGAFTLTSREGHALELEWYSGPVYTRDYIAGRVFIIHDRTAEHTAERLRSAFISRMSHELRTPLTAISGFAEFILEATGPDLPDLAREYTEIILHSARHLNRVFSDMIELSRADAGEIRLKRSEAHLPDIIIDVVARLELIYKACHQQVVMELDDDLPPLSVDVDRVAQVVTNLLNNAIKYAPEGAVIRISTRQLARTDDLPASAPPDVIVPAVLVTVRDSGPGLAPDEVEQVFLPLFRSRDAKAAKIEGAGLGLALARSLVEMHRGKLWAEARHVGDGGGRFFFTLPL